ncbi:hypothetical protein VOI54_15055 [Tamlana sp. 2201CG12-4]|uniref:hypothetical protein n=1 Tax=Tamlana sp. 2201CG12-4 TaxID=3112582 RepID=UPI002DB67CB7|nr:hypothetical protein [Tamlana sp. 2201CG12-4]MEC3908347.1 hypothetical protein [Tamlana sp. 2201CG12-4]
MKKLLPLMLLLFFTLNSIAQKNRERIKALKISFITEALDLSEKEAQQFWPIYNEYEKEVSKIRYKEIRAIRKETRDNMNTLSDAKAKELMDRLNSAENRLHQLKMDFHNKLPQVISTKKTVLLKVVEEDFKKKMFEEYKRKNHRSGGHKGG